MLLRTEQTGSRLRLRLSLSLRSTIPKRLVAIFTAQPAILSIGNAAHSAWADDHQPERKEGNPAKHPSQPGSTQNYEQPSQRHFKQPRKDWTCRYRSCKKAAKLLMRTYPKLDGLGRASCSTHLNGQAASQVTGQG